MPPIEIEVITGPTCTGKTALALARAAEDASIEIVNADAMLFYRGFDIGTAKPEVRLRERIPHHLIDIADPSEPYSAGKYSREARRILRELLRQGRTPIVAGGTGLYIRALFDGLIEIDIPDDVMQTARSRAEAEYASEGFAAMHERLRKVDPALHAQIERERNPLRLLRAWEHFYATGGPLGVARLRAPEVFEYRPRFTLLDLPRPVLWLRIAERVDAMLRGGWLEEARSLHGAGVTRDMPAMKAIGYRELFDVIEGQTTIEAARERIIVRTRQYAKRQVTWMNYYRPADSAPGGFTN